MVMASSTSSVDLAKKIAKELGGEFYQILIKKLTDPENPNRAIGAVTEWGGVYLSREALERGLTPEGLWEHINALVEEMQKHRKNQVQLVTPKHRPAIFVDVGSRTGYRLMAALQSVKTFIPKIIVVATPKISHRAFALINNFCDEVIALKVR
ncbi:MAG TPA: hypothetical protein VFV50_02010 [Bdellovibrionales bacterium]|nr:hypothetical protein [Bdellovibrionales bacterium]